MVSEEQNPVRGVVGQDFYVRCGKEGDKSEDTAQLREVYRGGELSSAAGIMAADVYLTV